MSISDHLTHIEGAGLKPANIRQAAMADLLLVQRKREGKREPEERYSFVSRQVQYAAKHGADPVLLIALAYFIGDPAGPPREDHPGPERKRSVQLMYYDKPLLLDTLIECLLDRRQGRAS